MTWYLLEENTKTEKYYVIVSENEMSVYRSSIKEIYEFPFYKVKLTLKEENSVVYGVFYDGASYIDLIAGDVIYRFDKKPSILMIEEVLPELFCEICD